MKHSDIVRLVSLGAIWGSSYIFMRTIAPVLGPMVTADLRILIAGIAFNIYFLFAGISIEWKKNWRHYLTIGMINSGIPFFMYAFAATHMPASYCAILNATSPFFGAIFSALWLKEKITPLHVLGMFLGISGVAFCSNSSAAQIGAIFSLTVPACLFAACCYALAAIYIKKYAYHIPPLTIAAGSLLTVGLLMLPGILLMPPPGIITSTVLLNLAILSLMCTGFAYMLYYRLIRDVGPTKALTVTFLIPVFGILWAVLFLDEMLTVPMITGCILIIAGVALVTRR